MSIDDFIDHIEKSNYSDRISDDEIHLRKVRNETSTTINVFVNNVVNRIQKIKLTTDQYEHIHEGLAGFRYLDNSLIFYPDSSQPMKVINVLFNDKTLDKLVTKNGKVISEKHEEPLSENLLEKYLDSFLN